MSMLGDFYQKAKKKVIDTVAPIEQSVSSGLNGMYQKAKQTLSAPAPQWAQNIPKVEDTFLPKLANTPQFNFSQNIDNPIGKFGAQLAEGTLNIPSKLMQNYGKTSSDIFSGKAYTPRGALQIAGRTGENALDVLSLGKGKAALQTGEQFLKGAKPLGTLMKEGWKQGTKAGTKYGLGYGLATGVQDENATPLSVAQNTAISGVAGRYLGGALGGGLPAVGALPGVVRNSVKNVLNRPKVTESIPAHFVPSRDKFPVGQVPEGYRQTGVQDSGFHGREAITEKLLPAQQKTNRAFPTITDWMSGVREGVPDPGMSIKAVDNPLLQEAGKYKTTINLQDKDDVAYLRQIFSDDIVNEIKSGKTTNWRGENYSDIARVNFISEVPQTVEQKLAGKIKDAKLNSDTFYHGTSSGSADSIMESGFKPGSKLPANAYRGGGYGKTQSTVSFAETPKEAGIFSTLTKDGKIVEAKLKPNARVASIDGIEDAVDLEDYIGYLRKQKIDAVYIGGGEKELVVINPKAVTPVKSQLTDLYNKAQGGPTLSDWGREVGSALPRPGMSIQDVSMGKPSKFPSIEQFLALPSGERKLALPNAPGYHRGEGFTMKPGSERNITDLFNGPAEGIYTVPVKDKNTVAKPVKVSSSYSQNPEDAPQNMGAVRRFFTGGDTVLNRSGKGGKEMSRLMEAQRKQEDLMRGGWNVHIDKALEGLSKEEVSNVDAVLRGEANPINAKTAGASKSLRNWFNSIGKTAENMGFEIQTPDGVKVPFKMRENYAPQMYDFTELQKGAKREKALQHLVDTGQARNLGEATKLLDGAIAKNAERRFGNLEKARTINLPDFERDPAIYAKKYAESIAKRFSEVNNFGMKDSRIAELINRIAQEGGDYNSAQRIFDYTTKGAPQNNVVNAISQYNLATNLDLSFITNAAQSINTMTEAGILNTLKGAYKGFTKEGKRIAEGAGVYDNNINVKETGIDLNKIVSGVMWPFKQVEKFNRRTAANAADFRAKELVARHQKEATDFTIRKLTELGIDPEKIASGKLSKEDLLSAAYELTKSTQFKVDPLDVPTMWKHPGGKLPTQFQSFSFMQTKFLRDKVFGEVAKGNWAPLFRFIPLAIGASFLTNKVRMALTGREEKDDSKNTDVRAWDKYLKAFGDFASGKIIQAEFLADTYSNDFNTPLTKVTRTLGSIGGPTVSKVGNVLTGLESMAKGYQDNAKSKLAIAKGTKEAVDPWLNIKRFTAGEVPIVGEYTKNKAFPYPVSKYSPEEKAQFAKQNAVDDAKVVNVELQRGMITPEEAQSKMQDIQDAYQKDVQKITEKAGGVINTAQAKENAPKGTDGRIKFNPVSGKYNYFDANGDYKSETKKKAELAVAKMDFESSEENFKDLGDTVLRKKPDGTSHIQRKAEYNLETANYELTAAKDDDDLESWNAAAEKKKASIESLMKDPSVDPQEKMKYEHELVTLAKQYARYAKLGDFTGAGKAKRMAEYNRKADLEALKLKVMSQLSSGMKASGKVPKTFLQSLGRGQQVQRRQKALIRY